MASATLQRAPALPTRIQVALVGLLLVLAGAGWAVTGDRMSGMDAGPGTDLGGARVVHRRVGDDDGRDDAAVDRADGGGPRAAAGGQARTGGGHPRSAPTRCSWPVTSSRGRPRACSATRSSTALRSLDLGLLAWDDAGRYVAGGVIVGAGLYQLTTPKDACLRHCRSPAMLLRHWHRGRLGALRMGVEHGGVCIGCCWTLMAALFALGVMSVAWMAFVAALIAAERLLPWKAPAVRAVAAVLVVLGLVVAFAPERGSRPHDPWLARGDAGDEHGRLRPQASTRRITHHARSWRASTARPGRGGRARRRSSRRPRARGARRTGAAARGSRGRRPSRRCRAGAGRPTTAMPWRRPRVAMWPSERNAYGFSLPAQVLGRAGGPGAARAGRSAGR